MPIRTDELMNVLAQLSEHENVRVCVKESAKGACIVGSSAFAGGVIGGPVGLAIGGMFGSVASLWFSQGKYRSVADVILHDMSAAQKLQLASSVQRVVQDLRVEDATLLLPLLLSNAPLKDMLVREVVKFIQNEMSMSIAA